MIVSSGPQISAWKADLGAIPESMQKFVLRPSVRQEYARLSQLPPKASLSTEQPLHPPGKCLIECDTHSSQLFTAAGHSRSAPTRETAPRTSSISTESIPFAPGQRQALPIPTTSYGRNVHSHSCGRLITLPSVIHPDHCL